MSVYSQNSDGGFDSDKLAVELTINGVKFTVEGLPQNGFVEVFNILGTKITGFQVNGGINTSRVNLPKGYYILKSDNQTKKIVIK